MPDRAAYIPNPMLEPEELKWAVRVECDIERGISASDLTNAIQQRLLELAADEKQVVVLVDEAQAMPERTLEGLRLLSNLETEKRKLLQVILVGQPELDAVLARKELRQLRQRITFSERLSSFSMAEVHRYIEHRTSAAGQPLDVFSRASAILVGIASGGVARLINIVCHKALLLAYSRGDTTVNSGCRPRRADNKTARAVAGAARLFARDSRADCASLGMSLINEAPHTR